MYRGEGGGQNLGFLLRTYFMDGPLRNKGFNIAKNPKYNGYQRGLASMVYKCFDKKFLVVLNV